METTLHHASHYSHENNATRTNYYCMSCAVRENNQREMMHMNMAVQLP